MKKYAWKTSIFSWQGWRTHLRPLCGIRYTSLD